MDKFKIGDDVYLTTQISMLDSNKARHIIYTISNGSIEEVESNKSEYCKTYTIRVHSIVRDGSYDRPSGYLVKNIEESFIFSDINDAVVRIKYLNTLVFSDKTLS